MKALHWSLLVISILFTAIGPAAAAVIPPQSPINIPNNLPVTAFADVVYENYGLSTGLHVLNEGSAAVNAAEKSMKVLGFPAGPGIAHKVTFENKTYELQNVHWHRRSEHYFNNQHFPMEMHLVHQHIASGEYLAIGRFITERVGDDANLADVFNNFLASGLTYNMQQALDLAPFQGSGKFYSYSGSLTHPHAYAPQAVKWIVYEEPIQLLSAAQMAQFAAFFPNNVRPIQPHDGTTGHNLVAMQVPEPGGLMLLAVAGLAAARRTRRS